MNKTVLLEKTRIEIRKINLLVYLKISAMIGYYRVQEKSIRTMPNQNDTTFPRENDVR